MTSSPSLLKQISFLLILEDQWISLSQNSAKEIFKCIVLILCIQTTSE